MRVDGNELELLAQAWKLRQAIQASGDSRWREVQRYAKAAGLSTDEYLYEWCRTRDSSDVLVDELIRQFESDSRITSPSASPTG